MAKQHGRVVASAVFCTNIAPTSNLQRNAAAFLCRLNAKLMQYGARNILLVPLVCALQLSKKKKKMKKKSKKKTKHGKH